MLVVFRLKAIILLSFFCRWEPHFVLYLHLFDALFTVNSSQVHRILWINLLLRTNLIKE
jgi:hypothetical protein